MPFISAARVKLLVSTTSQNVRMTSVLSDSTYFLTMAPPPAVPLSRRALAGAKW
jgi:hypothetical protein